MQLSPEQLLDEQIRQCNTSSGDPEVDELVELALEMKDLWKADPIFACQFGQELRTYARRQFPSTPRKTKPLPERQKVLELEDG